MGLAQGKQGHVLPEQVRRFSVPAAQPSAVSKATLLPLSGRSKRTQGPLDRALCPGSNSFLLMVTGSFPSEPPSLFYKKRA